MGSPRQEQRAYPRHECDLPVVIEMDTRTWGGVIANISRGGLLVVSTESLLPGRVGAFLFIVPGTYHVSRIMGTVRWVMNTANDPSGPACYGIESRLPEGVDHPTAISGSGDWEESMCEIDVDLTLEYESGSEERMVAEGVALGWGGCDG